MNIAFKKLMVSKKEITSAEITVIQVKDIRCYKRTTKAKHSTGHERRWNKFSSCVAITDDFM